MRKCLMVLMMLLMVTMASALVVGPYPADEDTLHLYHFDGYTTDVVRSNPVDLGLQNGASITAASASGFATALDTRSGGMFAGAVANPVLIANFVGDDGAFTFEAIVKPTGGLNPPHHMQLICGDDGEGPNERGWHFRINTSGNLQFTKITGVEDFQAAVPTSGDHAYQVDSWFHVAVTYTGAEGTPDNLKLYWTRLDSGVTEAQVLGSFQMNADMDAVQNTNFAVGNELRGSPDENFIGLMDSVRISAVARAAGEMMFGSVVPWAQHPGPANGAVEVDPVATTQLAWETADLGGVNSHYLYVAEDEPNFGGATATEVTDLTDPIESVITLTTDKTYYWRVDENLGTAGEPNFVTGPIWVFETIKSVPVIITDPADTGAFAGETGSFAATFNSLSSPAVTWYMQGDPNAVSLGEVGPGTSPVTAGDYTLTVTDLGNGSYTTSLEVANVELADEGEYFCSITNSSGLDSESDKGALFVKRLLSYYPFDGDPCDAIGPFDGIPRNNNDPGVLPDYTAGVFGEAISLNGSQYVELSTDAYPTSRVGGGLEFSTILCWVRLDAFTGGANMILGTHNDLDGPALQMWFGNNGNQINARLRQVTGEAGMPHAIGNTASSIVGDGQWHLLAVTFEKGDVGQLYLDGLPFGNADSYTATPVFEPWDYPLLIGGNNDRGTPKDFLTGALDELKFYNYPLSPEEVADAYLAGSPATYVCLYPYGSGFDFDNNCVVDLADFASIAQLWLDCGRYPASECGN